MQIRQTIHVSRPPDVVWTMLADVPTVVSCIPGAELREALGEDNYAGTFKLKVGPLTAKIDGEGQILRDDTARSGRIIGRGVDKRGGSRVSVTVEYVVASEGNGSVIEVSADTDLSGPLAQIGRTGIIEDIARRLTGEFSSALEQRLAATPASPPAFESEFAEEVSALPSPPPTSLPQPGEFDAGRAFSASFKARFLAFFRKLFGG